METSLRYFQTDPVAVDVDIELPADWSEQIRAIAAQNDLEATEISRLPHKKAVVTLGATSAIGQDAQRFQDAVARTCGQVKKFLSPSRSRQDALMLRRIYIHNYRTFINFEWAPPPACVVVGENGAGKSSLIEVLWALQDVAVRGKLFEETGFPGTLSKLVADGKTAEQTIEVDIEDGGTAFKYRLGCRQERGHGSIRETLMANGQLIYRSGDGKVELFGDDPPSPGPRTTIPFERRRSFLAALEPGADNRRIISFREALGAIWGLKPAPASLGATATGESEWLDRDLSNFASWYRARQAQDPDAADLLRQDLKAVLTGFSQLRLEPISHEAKELLIRFTFGEESHELGWAKLSDGQRLLVALYGAFRFALEKKARLIALDEVENYVAPAEIQPWLRLVADAAAKRNCQLLLVSHHPESIDYMAADAAWIMRRDETHGHSRIGQLTPNLDAGETAYEASKRDREVIDTGETQGDA